MKAEYEQGSRDIKLTEIPGEVHEMVITIKYIFPIVGCPVGIALDNEVIPHIVKAINILGETDDEFHIT